MGSGFTPKQGWVNVDLVGAPADLFWDLSLKLPLPENGVDGIFHEHLIEHLPNSKAEALTEECYRVLKPGAALRIAVPDAGLCLRSYAGTADPDWAESQPTPMLAVEALFYLNGHVAMYDAAKLTRLLSLSGFREVQECEYGVSRLDPCPDSIDRRDGTLYVEGIK
jgi:predicted SAM-dependent methyltransferase